MSDFDRLFDIKPVPTREEYEQAYIHYDQEVEANGGAWVDVTKRLIEISESDNVPNRYADLGIVARMFRSEQWPIGEEEIEFYPVELSQSQAFVKGFLQQIKPLQYLYSEKLTEETAIKTLHRFYLSQNVYGFRNKNEELDFDNSFVNAVSEYGLSKLTKDAAEIIEKWSEEVYPHNEEQARSFRMGHQVMIICGEQYQSFLNNDALNAPDALLDLDGEAQKILFSSTSEE